MKSGQKWMTLSLTGNGIARKTCSERKFSVCSRKLMKTRLFPRNGLKKRMNVGGKPTGMNRFGLTSIFSGLTWREWGVIPPVTFFAVTTGSLLLTLTTQVEAQTT